MKKIISVLLTFAIIFTAFVFPATAVDTTTMTGATFTKYHSYSVVDYSETGLRTMPKTMEAWVNYNQNSSHYSTIFGNYGSSKNTYAYRFVIVKSVPQVEFRYSADGTTVSSYKLEFTDITVPVNEWAFLAVSFDVETSQAHCYLNGVLGQTLTLSEEQLAVLNYEWAAIPKTDSYDSVQYATLGTYKTDITSTNRRDFYGAISYFAAYGDVRSDLEVAGDYENYKTPDTTDMLVGYNLSVDGRVAYDDLSGNSNRLAWGGTDFANLDEYTEVSEDDYAFSFAVIGDTQAANERASETVFKPMFDWLKNNVASKKIKAVISVGDITNNNSPAQWQNAKDAYSKLDGLVPTFPILGNHDNTEKYADDAKIGLYKEYMKFEKDDMSDSYDGSINTYYRKVHVGGIKYLILAISYGHTSAERAWAENVIKNNPDYNVIITTHGYLFASGKHLNRDGAPELYSQLVLPYSNVVLVTCGHMRGDNVKVTTETRSDGSVVQQMFTNPQDADAGIPGGVVTMLYFSEDGKNVTVRNYATALDCYLGSENPESFTLDIKGGSTIDTYNVVADESGKLELPIDGNVDRGLLAGWYKGDELVTKDSVFSPNETVSLTAKYADLDTSLMSALVDTTGVSADNNPVPTDAKYINGLYLQGTQVRVPEKDGKSLGLRFIAMNNLDVSDAIETAGMKVKRGMVVISSKYLDESGELSIGDYKSSDVPANRIYVSSETLGKNYEKYTACVVNIPEANLETDIVVRPYFIYTDLSGGEHIFYGEQYSCSIYKAAKAAYEAVDNIGNYIETEEVRQALYDSIIKLVFGDNNVQPEW